MLCFHCGAQRNSLAHSCEHCGREALPARWSLLRESDTERNLVSSARDVLVGSGTLSALVATTGSWKAAVGTAVISAIAGLSKLPNETPQTSSSQSLWRALQKQRGHLREWQVVAIDRSFEGLLGERNGKLVYGKGVSREFHPWISTPSLDGPMVSEARLREALGASNIDHTATQLFLALCELLAKQLLAASTAVVHPWTYDAKALPALEKSAESTDELWLSSVLDPHPSTLSPTARVLAALHRVLVTRGAEQPTTLSVPYRSKPVVQAGSPPISLEELLQFAASEATRVSTSVEVPKTVVQWVERERSLALLIWKAIAHRELSRLQ